MSRVPNHCGKEVVCDIYLSECMSDDDVIKNAIDALDFSNMTIVSMQKHHFTPHGLTACWILAESHFAIHTYPEDNYITVDCYTCGGKGDPEATISRLLELLPVKRSKRKTIKRGLKRTLKEKIIKLFSY